MGPNAPSRKASYLKKMDRTCERKDGLRVLLVDDHEDTRWAIANYLEQIGSQVEQASSLREARNKLAQAPCDLLLSDISLPDGVGLELGRCTGFSATFAVSMSAHDFAQSERASAAAGFRRHLQKPIGPLEIDDIISGTREFVARSEQSRPRSLHSIVFSAGKEAKEKIVEIVSARYPEFSLFAGSGFWDGKEECAHQLLVVTDDASGVGELATELKNAFRQDSVVLITYSAASVRFV